LAEAPWSARHLIDLSSYHYTVDGVRAQSVICQLGCPFGCHFCGGRRSPFLRRSRIRSTDAVIAELRHLYDTYGTRGFMFFDDELNVNKQFVELLDAISGLQDELGVEFRLRGFLKAELTTPAMTAAMYRAGFRQVLVGFESGHPRILQNIQKRATREDNTRAVEMLHGAGIQVKAAMSIGHPGESPETVDATREWLLEVQPDEFDVTIITVFPGTPYFDDARETAPGLWAYTDPRNGDRLYAHHVDHLEDVAFYKGIPGSYQSYVYTDHLSAVEMVQARDALESEVRSALQIAYPTTAAALNYEHSMGAR
jgi:anaerobic magnesium-protoporphyrin IX monomethyl ester cyclase